VVPLEQTECVYNVASEVDMPTYICLTRWTSKGLENVKDSPSRLDAARKAFQAAGVILKDFYMVTGRYDMILIAEAPDDTTLAKAVLSVAVKGSIQTETLRAFTENEYRGIVSGL
jgi:uncharacterized protein with GYD domain